jgi:hypothetical protein
VVGQAEAEEGAMLQVEQIQEKIRMMEVVRLAGAHQAHLLQYKSMRRKLRR